MFDSFVMQKRAERRRFRAGTAISLAMHLGLVAAVPWIATRHKVVEARPEVEVVFFRPPQPAPPPPPPAAARSPKQHKVTAKPHPVVQ
jgi:periplasmic protein TonB